MNLKSLRAYIAADAGIDINNTERKAYLDEAINFAASELYHSQNLVGSLYEETFILPEDTREVSLPARVGSILAVRWHGHCPINIGEPRLKYASEVYVDTLYNWKFFKNSPLQQTLENYSTFTTRFKRPCAETVTVAITGQTEHASEYTEDLVFAIGDDAKSTTATFEQIISLTKSNSTTYDCDIEDASGNIVSSIPNKALSVNYNILQVADADDTLTFAEPIDVLYKKEFQRLVNDGDVFQCPDYSTVLHWKVLEFLNKSNVELALAANAKAVKLIQDITTSLLAGVTNKIEFAANPYYTALTYGRPRV